MAKKTLPADYIRSDIQANILKFHGRAHGCFIFFRFNDNYPKNELRKALSLLAKEEIISSYQRQLDDSKLHKTKNLSERSVIGLYISKTGFGKLGVDNRFCPDDQVFNAGCMMDDPQAKPLGDYKFNHAHSFFKNGGVHGMFLVANENKEVLEQAVTDIIENRLGKALERDVFRQYANYSKRDHFGYLDGLSTPLNEDELRRIGLVKEPSLESYGSYVAFRKIEMDVVYFDKMVKCLAKGVEKPEEYAKALLMGRFPDGTPLTLFNENQPEINWENVDFEYADDNDGSKCPFHAHIRVMNPRETKTGVKIIRRGMNYEDIDGKKGLCFMSYQNSLKDGFLPLFRHVEDPNIPVDALTYRTNVSPNSVNHRLNLKYYKEYGNNRGTTHSRWIAGDKLTRFKGGDYFFAPSLSFFKNLETL